MTKFTVDQLEEQLNALPGNEEWQDNVNVMLPTDPWTEESYPLWLKQVGDDQWVKVDFVEHVGGEGQGDTVYMVLETGYGDQKRFFKKNGSYDSYNGSDWEYGNFQEVYQTEKVIKVWEPKS